MSASDRRIGSSTRRALFRAGYRDLVRRPLHTALMLTSISLGVAVVVAIDLANQSARRAFELSTEAVVGRATHQIVGGPNGIDEALYSQLRVNGGLSQIAPVIQGLISLQDRPVRLLGIDPFAELPFRGDLGQSTPFESAFASFYTDPNQVILSAALADEIGLSPGDIVEVQVNQRQADLRVLGILTGQGSVELAFMDIAAAQELLGMQGRLSRIDVIADAAAAQVLQQRLPVGVRLEGGGAQVDAAQQLSAAFSLNLSALSLLALVVGMFLIYNTMSFSVLRRRTVFGTLRSLGVGGGQLRLQIYLEAALVGAIGSVCGILLGWLLSKGAVALVSQTINDFYFLLSVRSTQITAGIIVKATALGLVATILAAALPAWEASQVPPIQVLRRSESELRARSQLPRLGRAALILIGLGSALFLGLRGSLVLTFGAMMLVLIGLALLVPLVTDWTFRRLAKLRTGLGARLALRGVSRHLSRTGIAVSSLMVALSVAIGVTLMIDSFRSTVENWLAVTLQSDLYISSPASAGTRPQAALPAELLAEIQAVPGVQVAEALRAVVVASDSGEVQLSAVDPQRVRDGRLYRFASGSAEQIWQQLIDGAVLVSESFVFRHGSKNQITLFTDRGPVRFPIAAVFYDYSTDQGTLLMSRTVYQGYWDDPAISSIGVTLAPGTAAGEVARSIRLELAGTGLEVLANADLREQALQIFDRTFTITSALRLLAVVVAVIGVVSALLALQLERSREFATLAALGMSPAGLQLLSLRESLYLGFSAALLSFPTGVLLALALINVINVRAFGWTIRLQLTPNPFLQALLAGSGAALVAAIYPALRMGRVAVSAALSRE